VATALMTTEYDDDDYDNNNNDVDINNDNEILFVHFLQESTRNSSAAVVEGGQDKRSQQWRLQYAARSCQQTARQVCVCLTKPRL
jgi:hypothetical protein